MQIFDVGNLFAIALVLPLVAALFSLILARFEWSNAAMQLLLMFSGLVGFVALEIFFTQSETTSTIPLPLDIHLSVGLLSGFFLALVYLGTFLTSIYNIGSLPRYRKTYTLHSLNCAFALFIFGMQATIMSSTVFSFLGFWEIMSVAAYFLVIADRSDESLRAGFMYFMMTHIGFACLMSGFLILAHGAVFATWNDVAASASSLSPAWDLAAFVLLFAGFGSKAGLVPLHQWLPYAHPQAPSGSSALLSGVMLKVALFGFIQSLALFPSIPLSWSLGVVVIGLVSALFGVVHAAVDNDAKRLLAWSSIENMGLLFSGIGLILVLRTLPLTPIVGALIAGLILFVALHTINHFLFKTGLFMAVGAVVTETHTRDLDLLGGLAQKWPLFSGVFLALALAAAALPPSGTFFGEWAYVQTLAVGMSALPVAWAFACAIALAIVALVGGLAIFAFVKLFSSAFLGRARSHHAEEVASITWTLVLPPLLCACSSVVVGLFAFTGFSALLQGFSPATQVFASVSVVSGAAINSWFVVALLAAAVALALVFRALATNGSRARITDTWDCGASLTPRMEYTATGFAAPIRFFFRSLVLSSKGLIAEPVVAGNPWIARRRLEWSLSSFWEEWLYLPVALIILRASSYVRKLQSGVIQIYLIFTICALVVVIIAAL